MERSYNIPVSLDRPDVYESVLLGATVTLAVSISYFVSLGISGLIPSRRNYPWLLRLRRIIHLWLFTWLGFWFALVEKQETHFWVIIAALALLSSPVLLLLLIREYAYPLIYFRKTKSWAKRLTKFRKNGTYKSSGSYVKDLLSGAGVLFVCVPFILSLLIAGRVGIRAADPNKKHDYIIIESKPRRIVLIDYGSRWLTAEYEEPLNGRPAYRQKFSIVNEPDMSKYPFTIKSIDVLYHYK